MKKFLAIALSLVMVLAMVATACAETRTYVMAAVTDLEGNELPIDEMPVLVFGMDNETMECAFGTTDETKPGTFEVAGSEDGVYAIVVTIDNESALMEYVEAEDLVTYVDEANGYIYYMFRYEDAE